ncbi:unnamed protein product [Heligmosomoides polygyrus]|uniref:Lipase maturation factor 2 n=1 Tax=Heligmosomoides polygyrus TaxID=6339 RepID=A0A183G235_HELPZ|nr:unnamed protein product [Heligmosomoides polygyrus]
MDCLLQRSFSISVLCWGLECRCFALVLWVSLCFVFSFVSFSVQRSPLKSLHEAVVPYNTINSYGLFRRMTGLNGRPEIIVEGAYDPNGPWREFRFYSKPGNVSEAPVFVLPHQPRLDWQMWFAALGSYQYNPFYINLVYHLMEGTPEVMRLMSKPQPFEVPPTFVRAKLYHYFYTKFGEEKDWWTRELQYEYMPIFNKGEQVVLEYLTKNRLVLSSEYSGGIFDFILSKLHGIVYETDQAIFVWGVLVATMLVIMTNFLYSIDLFSLLNSLQDYGI